VHLAHQCGQESSVIGIALCHEARDAVLAEDRISVE
jgi:hypothetical protein